MKKLIFTLIISASMLCSCLSDSFISFEDEMEMRKSETPEQTVARQNKTLEYLQSKVDKAAESMSVYINGKFDHFYKDEQRLPSNCKEANADLKQFLEKFSKAIELEGKYQEIYSKSGYTFKTNTCNYCKSAEYASAKPILEDIKKIDKLGYFGMLEPSISSYYSAKRDAILQIINVCQQDDTIELFESVKEKLGNNEAYFRETWQHTQSFNKLVKPGAEKITKDCAEYNISEDEIREIKESMAKIRQAIKQGKLKEWINNNKDSKIEFEYLSMMTEESCHNQYWGASEKQCKCMTDVTFEWFLNMVLDGVEAKANCEYKNGMIYLLELKRKIRQQCGLE